MAFINSLGGAGLIRPLTGSLLQTGTLRPFSLVRQRQDLLQLDDTLRTLRRQLDRLERRGPSVGNTAEPGSARAFSSAGLDLRAVETAARLESTDEVNATPTSFTPFGPTVSGDTTSLPTVGGVYDGDQGDDTLTFQFRDNRTVGSDRRLRVRVRDGEGNTIANLNFRNRPPDTPLTLPNGLTLSLGAGDVESGDTFQVQVSTSVGSAVDPTKPFDGTRNDQPNFEVGQSVTAGSFEVNGVSIAVSADDTIEAVVARITASAAGVTASFDAGSERVVLVQNTTGPEPTITLANDTSGFLAATKLAAASVVPGVVTDPVRDPIASVAELSSIASGDFRINGEAISVDRDADSLDDVVARINASDAGVRARLDQATGRLSLIANRVTDPIVLEDGTSGFLAALSLADGTYTPRRPQTEAATVRPENLREDLKELGRTIAGLFRASFAEAAAAERADLQSLLRETVTDTFGRFFDSAPGDRLRSGFGIDFDFRDAAADVLALDAARLERAAANDGAALRDFLFADGDAKPGLIPAVIDAIGAFQGRLDRSLGRVEPAGRLVDLRT